MIPRLARYGSQLPPAAHLGKWAPDATPCVIPSGCRKGSSTLSTNSFGLVGTRFEHLRAQKTWQYGAVAELPAPLQKL